MPALCLYGVSSSHRHEVKPVNGIVDLLRALNDPYVRKALGLLIELLRSMGRCLEAAEKVKEIGISCGPEVPCYLVAYGLTNNNGTNDVGDGGSRPGG